MTLTQVKYFMEVASCLSFTEAARRLYVSQQVVSKQVGLLEDELGVKLFCRSKHRITLTAEGLLLKRRGQEITELAERTTREVSRSSENLMGEIAIGCAEASSISVLAGLMNYFLQKYPLVHYTLYSGIADDI